MIKVMEERHSVRSYLDKLIEEEKRKELDDLINQINSLNNLNIQIIYDEPTCFNSMMAHYGKFKGVSNYISLVGVKNKDLDENLGYYGEMIVLKAQEIGLNTCFVAMTHGKSKAIINKNEKEVCLISIGYGESQGVAHKNKAIEKVSNYQEGMPEWFLDGVKAALLAPTAMNQQKFYLEYLDSGKVKIKKGIGFYTSLDLGIVKYNFEMGSNQDSTIWIED